MDGVLVTILLLAAIVAVTIGAIIVLARRDVPLAREFLQATIPIELAMLAALIATWVLQH